MRSGSVYRILIVQEKEMRCQRNPILTVAGEKPTIPTINRLQGKIGPQTRISHKPVRKATAEHIREDGAV
jgi:hypothetical protein